MDKQNENHSVSKNPILSSLLDSQKVNDNRKRSNQEEHEDESEEYVKNMHPTVDLIGIFFQFGKWRFFEWINSTIKKEKI